MRFATLILATTALLLTAGLFLVQRHFLPRRSAVSQSASLSGTPQDKPPLPPLIAAAAAGEPEVVRRLLDQGADVAVRCSVLHDHTALEAAIWHRQNDIERVAAVPNDPGGESMRNQPMPPDGAVQDENYREVIGMLREAAQEAKTHRKPRTGSAEL